MLQRVSESWIRPTSFVPMEGLRRYLRYEKKIPDEAYISRFIIEEHHLIIFHPTLLAEVAEVSRLRTGEDLHQLLALKVLFDVERGLQVK
jgi:hypothetical protein